MKIAVAGKGGSGKTTLAGTLARMLGRRGHAILAIDADSNPNLPITLGIPREVAMHIEAVPREIMEDRLDASGQHVRTLALPYPDVMARYSTAAADNTRVLEMVLPQHGLRGGVGSRAPALSLITRMRSCSIASTSNSPRHD
jgi:CO dehydrogenase maturation factor